LGSNQLQSTDENRLVLTTSTYVINDRFDPMTSLAHDVAVIKLRMPITFTDYIQPIVYANMGYIYPGRVVEAAGWGQTGDDTSGLVNDLNVVEVSIIDQHACQTYYGDQLWGSMVCAEGNYNEGICFGDIGGPLVTPALIGNHSVAVAIASFISANGCESLDPTGYTRIDSYNGWIKNATTYN
jgi:secreted trypsin-like serine protease